MKENKINKLRSELKYLVEEERENEIKKISKKIDENTDVKKIAQEIYLERGLDYQKLNANIFLRLINEITNVVEVFKNKNGKDKRKMILEIVYIVLLLILIKIPFNLVCDIGLEYINVISNNKVLNYIWNLAFLLLYTITIICTLIVLLRNFINKYNKNWYNLLYQFL